MAHPRYAGNPAQLPARGVPKPSDPEHVVRRVCDRLIHGQVELAGMGG